MSTPTLYKHKNSARAAAIKALGQEAEFEVAKTDDGRFYWIDTSAAAAEAAGAENDPVATTEPQPEDVAWEAPQNPRMAPGYMCPDLATMPELSELAPTVAESPAVAATNAEPFEEPEEKADLTVDLGITPELAALIYGLGEAAGAAIPVPQKRKGLLADAWAAVERGELPETPKFPASNSYAAIHAEKLRSLTEAGDKNALEAYLIGGSNTYSKALRSYREALLAYLNNGAMKEAA